MAANLHKIKHWQIICGNYTKAPDIEATWFIDPPYEGDSGSGYNHSNGSIRYDELAEWVLERQGEVICCEGKGASYLPFEPLITLLGIAGKRSREMIFYRSPYAPVQLSLFSPGGILAKEPQG
jgi:hypothetical protein